MNTLTIERQNGSVPRSLAGEDHISALLFYMPEASVPAAFKKDPVAAVSVIERAEALGITSSKEAAWEVRVLHYQLAEIFRTNPAVSLYVGVFAAPAEEWTFDEIAKIQRFAAGTVRQMAVWAGSKELAAAEITAIQAKADALDAENAPLSVLYAPKVTSVADLPDNLAGANQCRVSVLIGQDGGGTAAALYTDEANTEAKSSVTAAGTVLGLLSKAQVHQSIGWVKAFPTGISLPAFADGTLYRDTDRAAVEKLDNKGRYLFFVTHTGQAGSYLNDSHTMDSPESDYAMIEAVRTMDKAVRGIRAFLTPELGGNVYIDPDTGRLRSYSVSHLETVAGRALEDMEKAGELSGYKAEIDPAQDVLATSAVEVVIRQIAVGVMRKIRVKIGFAKSL